MKFHKLVNTLENSSNNNRVYLIAAILMGFFSFFIYGQTWTFDFVDWDDPLYITNNVQFLSGLDHSLFAWAFTSYEAGYWHPITWLSHALDVWIWGFNPGGHHITNAIIHTISSFLLFAYLMKATSRLIPSFMVGLLFLVHPLHVESVAWVSERKDVLSGFFLMLTLHAHLVWVKNPNRIRMVVLIMMFTLSVMCKPTVSIIPFLLVLLEFWPLRRWGKEKVAYRDLAKRIGRSLFYEKIILLSISSGIVISTILVQSSMGNIHPLDQTGWTDRLSIMLLSYSIHIWKAIYPIDLMFFYPMPDSIAGYSLVLGFILILIVSIFAWFFRGKLPWLTVGWLWFIGVFFPVSGVITLSHQLTADRFSYIPLVGLLLIVAWGSESIRVALPKNGGVIIFAISTIWIVWLSNVAKDQTQTWKNSEAMFRHAVEVGEKNWLAMINLANYLNESDERIDEALDLVREGLKINANNGKGMIVLGNLLRKKGDFSGAIEAYKKAVLLMPNNEIPLYNLGAISQVFQDYESSEKYYLLALTINKKNSHVLGNYAELLATNGRDTEAEEYFKRAVIEDKVGEVVNSINYARLMARQGRFKEASELINKALLVSTDVRSRRNMENLLDSWKSKNDVKTDAIGSGVSRSTAIFKMAN